MIDFIKTIFGLSKDIIISTLEVILSLVTDLKSFRNKLVFFTCGLVLIIILEDKDYRISLAALGLLEFFLCYYFNNRKIKDNGIISNIIDKVEK